MSNQVTIEVIEAPPVSVEVVDAGGVQVVEIDRPATVSTVEVIVPGPQGPSGARERRHAWSPPYSYCGKAPVGTAEGIALWTVTRLQINSSGSVVATGVATPIAWINRTTAIYS